MNKVIQEKLEFVYGSVIGKRTAENLENLLNQWKDTLPEINYFHRGKLPADQKDAVMITYGDSIQKDGMTPLAALNQFAQNILKDVLSGIHILPFSPYSSDDGFSVMDYRQVNPDLGTWKDIEAISQNFRLMADLVLNHCSSRGLWFQRFLNGDKKYADYFITVEPGTDLSGVFRPRALPLTHEFDVAGEKKLLWTTFSNDQVDLNFANPDVFLEFVDILLGYVRRGVRIIRLDAVGFLWKEIGTSCMHHPKTHEIVKIFRLILEESAAGVMLITETNVPHSQNIAYFGNGCDEAHMVYQFSLPPLTLDAFIRSDASKLSEWALSLPEPSDKFSFFNFLASHDGIGVLPAKGYLNEQEIRHLVDEVQARGGLVSYKSTPDGEVPYELNITYLDAVAEADLPMDKRAVKFLSSQAVMLAMAGVPGIYVHSLLGSGNWIEGVSASAVNRSINREKLKFDMLELDNPESLRGQIFSGFAKMLKARSSHPAFHPASAQQILHLGSRVFALIRGSDNSAVLALQSVSSDAQQISLPEAFAHSPFLDDLISGRRIAVEGGKIRLDSWEVLWVTLP